MPGSDWHRWCIPARYGAVYFYLRGLSPATPVPPPPAPFPHLHRQHPCLLIPDRVNGEGARDGVQGVAFRSIAADLKHGHLSAECGVAGPVGSGGGGLIRHNLLHGGADVLGAGLHPLLEQCSRRAAPTGGDPPCEGGGEEGRGFRCYRSVSRGEGAARGRCINSHAATLPPSAAGPGLLDGLRLPAGAAVLGLTGPTHD